MPVEQVPIVFTTTAVGLLLFKISNIVTGSCWAVIAAMLWRARKLHPLGGGCEAVVIMMLTMVIWSFLRVIGVYMIAYPWMTGILTATTLVAACVVAKTLLNVHTDAAKNDKNTKALADLKAEHEAK